MTQTITREFLIENIADIDRVEFENGKKIEIGDIKV